MSQTDPRLTFFPKRQVRAYLKGWVPKNNAEGEKRIRLDFEIPMLDEARDGMIPGWIINELNAMEAEGSKGKDSDFDTVLEGITLDFFDTPNAPHRSLLLSAATLDGFFLTRTQRDGKTFIALAFNTNVKRDHSTLFWADKYEKCYLWVEATLSSPEMPSKPAPGEQMTIADATAAPAKTEEEQQSESVGNISLFFAGDAEVAEGQPSDGLPVQTAERAAAVAEIPAGHEECVHCHQHFPRAAEPANWIEGKVRKVAKAPLPVRKALGTGFGSVCGKCVNELTPKPDALEDHGEELGQKEVVH